MRATAQVVDGHFGVAENLSFERHLGAGRKSDLPLWKANAVAVQPFQRHPLEERPASSIRSRSRRPGNELDHR
jgi:hypothetical protein